MKLNRIFVIVSVLLFLSCKEKSLNIESSTVYGTSIFSGNYQKYKLEIKKTDSLDSYNYHHQENFLGNLFIRYNEKDDYINSKFGKFTVENKSKSYRGFTFKYYSTKTNGPQTSIIVFNKEYGIIATSTYGARFLFLKDSLPVAKTKEIFDEIIPGLK